MRISESDTDSLAFLYLILRRILGLQQILKSHEKDEFSAQEKSGALLKGLDAV